MSGFLIETLTGDPATSVDYGEMFLKSDLSASRVLVFSNPTAESIDIQVKDAVNEEYRLVIKLLALGEEDDNDSEIHFLQMISEMPQESIKLSPYSKTRVLFLLSSTSLPSDAILQRKARTSFTKVSPQLKFVSCINGQAIAESVFPVQISLCVSLFSVDETEIEFDSCYVGNTYVRDVQIWNRSEGVLQYRVLPSRNDERLSNSSSLRISDLDSGKNLLGRDRPLTIPAFSSQRVRISFNATHIEDSVHRFCLENCNNPSNNVVISCRLTVFAQDDVDELIVENDSGAMIGVDGRVFDFGDCYNGLETVRKLWLKNNTTNTIEISISTDCPKEIVVDTVNDQASNKDRSGGNGILPPSGNSAALHFGGAFPGGKAQSVPRAFKEENASGNNQKRLRNGKELLGVGKSVADSLDVPLRVTFPQDSSEDPLSPSSTFPITGTMGKVKKGKIHEKFQCHEHQSSSSYLDMDLYAGDFDSDDYCPGSQLRLQRFFTVHGTQPSHGRDYVAYSNEGGGGYHNLHHTDHGKSKVVLRQQQQPQKGLKVKKNSAVDPKIVVRSRETDVVVLPPGGRKPFYLKFLPICQRKEASIDSVYGATTNVLRDKPLGVSREGKDKASNGSGGRDRDSKKSASSSVHKAFSHAHRSEGVLERRTMKVTFMYKTAARNTKSDRHSDNHVKSKQKIFSKVITCRAKTCTSIITCTPKVLDLGECNIGDYRNVVFTIKNESDLPALVLPYMESQSLGLVEKELQILPRQTKQCKFEYIARNIENDYHKNILLINVFNSHCNLVVQVKAKISDAHQVLRHSLFYKIHTRHNKKQLQVYFSKCIYNMPNLKTFVFRNVYSKAVRVELTVDDPTDLGIYLHRPTDSYRDQKSAHYEKLFDGTTKVEQSDENANSSTAHHKIMKIEELKWGNTDDANDIRRKRTKSVGIRTDSSVSSLAGDLAMDRDSGYLSDGQVTLGTSKSSSNVSALLDKFMDPTAPTSLVENDSPNLGDKKSFVHYMDTNDFPFSILQGNNLSALEQENLNRTGVDMDLLASESMKENISIVKKCYNDLKEDLVFARHLLPLSTSAVRRSVVVPPGKSYEFAVLFTPKLPPKVDGSEEEPPTLQMFRKINLQLLSTDPTDVDGKSISNGTVGNAYDTLSASLTSYQPLMHAGTPLKPRILLMKAKLIISRMKVTQKNINFGNTKVGELSRSSTTVANLSNFPLVYSISKSGSISSGFLSVTNGRKGIIEPLSTKNIEFAFKPTLHGPFEETLNIENVLDSSNSKAVIIKAKVFKQELFTIQPLEAKDIAQYTEEEPLVHTVNNYFETEIMTEVAQKFSDLSKYTVEAPPPVYLGRLQLRVPSTVSMKFKICNISSKNRQFMIDCKNTLNVFRGNRKMSEDFGMHIQCRVVGREQLQLKSSNADRNMTEDEKQQLRDKLEKFNQKLKIAIRKKKPDKIEKYEKKIKDAEATLADGKFKIDDDNEEEEDNVSKLKKKEIEATAVTLEAVEDSEAKKRKSEQDLTKVVGSEEMVSAESFTFPLSSEEAAVIIVNVIVYPTVVLDHVTKKRNRDIPYSLSGSLRVFESKNEDDIRNILFGALIAATVESDIHMADDQHESGLRTPPRRRRCVESQQPSMTSPPRNSVIDDSTSLLSVKQTNSQLPPRLRDYSTGDKESPDRVLPIQVTIPPWCLGAPNELYPQSQSLPNISKDYVSLISRDQCLTFRGEFDVLAPPPASGPLELLIWMDFNLSQSLSALAPTTISEYLPSVHGNMTITISQTNMDPVVRCFEEITSTSTHVALPSFFDALRSESIDQLPLTCTLEWKNKAGKKLSSTTGLIAVLGVTLQTKGNSDVCITSVSAPEIDHISAQKSLTPPNNSVGLKSVSASSGIGMNKSISAVDRPVDISFNTVFVPVLCSPIRVVSIKAKESLSFGEMVQGTTIVSSLQLTNTNLEKALNYIVVCPNTSTVGKASILSADCTGIIAPSESGYIQIEFQSLQVGKYDDELVIMSTKDQDNWLRVALSATVTIPQSQLVQFPDLAVDEVGKENKLDLGQIQIPLSNGNNVSKHQQEQNEKQKFIYPFRVMNIYKKILFVSAVSNLKKQCFIYIDEECLLPVINYPLAPGVMATLYIVIRPTLIATQQRNVSANNAADLFVTPSSRSTRDDKPSTLGRELVGGIRFIFLNEPMLDADTKTVEAKQSDSKHTSLSRVTSAEELSISRTNSGSSVGETSGVAAFTTETVSAEKLPKVSNKVFESSVSFKVLVGTSLPRIHMRTVRCRCISVDHQASVSRTLSGIVKGYFEIENKSQTFPYKYDISVNCKGPAALPDEDSVLRRFADMVSKTSYFYILGDNSSGEVRPASKKRITFVVLFRQVYGLLAKFLDVKNVMTGQVEKVYVSLFFDPCKIFARLPRPLKSVNYGSKVDASESGHFWPSVRSQHIPGILSSTNVFATQIDQMVSDMPLWVSMVPSAAKTVFPPFTSTLSSDSTSDKSTTNPSALTIAAALPTSGPTSGAVGATPISSSSSSSNVAGISNSAANSSVMTERNPLAQLPDLAAEGLTDESMMSVTGGCEDVICSWQLSNPHNAPLRISPASDLPVVVLFEALSDKSVAKDDAPLEFQNTHASSIKALGSYLKGKNKKAVLSNQRVDRLDPGSNDITGLYSKKNKEQRSMVSVPPELDAQGFSLCGSAITIPPLQAIRVIVKGNPGKRIAHHLRKHRSRWPALMSGSGLKVMGTIAFISAEETLKSFFYDPSVAQGSLMKDTFAPPSSATSKQNKTSKGVQIPKTDIYPIVGYTSVITSFVIPLIKAPRTKFNFGTIQSYKRHIFDIDIENLCDQDVPIRIENIHPWITVMEGVMLKKDAMAADVGGEDTDKKNGVVDSNLKNKVNSFKSLVRVLPARGIHTIKMCVTVPYRVTEKKFDQTLRIRNLAMSSNLSGRAMRTTFPVQLSFDIDYNSGLCLLNEDNGALPFSDKLQSHFVKIDKVPVPFRYDADNSIGNVKTIVVKNTTLEYIRVFYGTREAVMIKGLASLKLTKKEDNTISDDFASSPICATRSQSGSEDFKLIELPPPVFRSKCLPFFELMPGESAEFDVSIQAEISGRVSSDMMERIRSSSDFVEEDEEKYPDRDSDDGGSDDEGQYSDDRESIGSMVEEDEDSKCGVVVGPLIFGKVFFKFSVISMSENDASWAENNVSSLPGTEYLGEDDSDHDGEHALYEHLDVSILGSIVPCPTLFLEGAGGKTLSSFSYEACRDLTIPSTQGNAMDDRPHKTAVAVQEKSLHFTIRNTTDKELSFRLSCSLERKQSDYSLLTLGNLNDISNNEASYSSSNAYEIGYQQGRREGDVFNSEPMRDARHDLLPSVLPSEAPLQPGESVQCTIKFMVDALLLETTHQPSFGTESYRTLFANLRVLDMSCPSHPPLVLPIYLSVLEKNDIDIGQSGLAGENVATFAEGVSLSTPLSTSTSASGQHVTTADTNSPQQKDKTIDARRNLPTARDTPELEEAAPLLRLRGVTPCAPGSTQYEINLGQEVQQQDQSKWVVSLLNTSVSNQLRYSISTLCPDVDSKWMSVSLTDGVISPDGTASLALHFMRVNVGVFLTYLIIENHSNPHDIVMVRISLQVVQDWRLLLPEQRENRQLFRIEAPLGWHVMDTYLQQRLRQWNHRSKSASFQQKNTSSSVTQDWKSKTSSGSGSGRGVMDFGSVYMGKVYTRRYFILVNLSDIPLEFHLSSSFNSQELDFSLTPVLPSPLSVVTVGPRERLCIYIVFTPQINSHDESGSMTSSINFTGHKAKDKRFLMKSTRHIEGSIFVSCKLVKNHHEAINIRATAMLPSVGIFLKEQLLHLPSVIPSASASASSGGVTGSEFMQLGVPEYADVSAGDGDDFLRINTNNSSSTMKDGRWTTASIISIRHITQISEPSVDVNATAPTIITVYTGMANNGFQVRLLEFGQDGQVDELLTATKNAHWREGGGEGGGRTLDIPLKPQEECYLHIAYDPTRNVNDKLSRQHARTNSCDLTLANSSTNTFTILAEDHFMIYNRSKISEKTRIPVRLLLAITNTGASALSSVPPTLPKIEETVGKNMPPPMSYDQLPNLALDLDQKSAHIPLITNISPTTEIPLSFAGLEGTISSFLKSFSLFWSKVFSKYATLPTASLHPVQSNSLNTLLMTSSAAAAVNYKHSRTSNSTPPPTSDVQDAQHLGNDLLITEQEPQQNMGNFFSELRRYLAVTDNSIYEHNMSPDFVHQDDQNDLRHLAHEMAELHVHFVAITDMLVLHTMRQSYHGHEWMTSAHSAIPVAKLSLLVFSMVFRHPIFVYYCQNGGENQKSEDTLFPPPLIPFARTLLYYMSFFPDTPPEMEPLNTLCKTLRECLQVKIR